MAVTNEEEFEAWVKGQSQEVCTAIAYRAAMRVLPFAVRLESAGLPQRVPFSLGSSDNSFFVLSVFRACLTSWVSALRVTPELDAACASVSQVLSKGAEGASPPCTAAAFRSAAEASRANPFLAVQHSAAAFSSSVANSVSATAAVGAAFSSREVAQIVAFSDAEQQPNSLMRVSNPVPEVLAEETVRYRNNGRSALDEGGPWTFWAEWYAAAMKGEPLDWKLQEAVALIPDEVWEAGPEAVAAEIARIEAKFELRARIAELGDAQIISDDARLGIGGNSPPEEIEDPQVAEQVTIIWDAVAGLKEEVEAEDPDASRVAALIEKLGAALKAVLVWCGRKGDLVVDTTITTSIKYVIPAGATGYFILVPSKAEAVLKAAQTWLPFVAP